MTTDNDNLVDDFFRPDFDIDELDWTRLVDEATRSDPPVTLSRRGDPRWNGREAERAFQQRVDMLLRRTSSAPANPSVIVEGNSAHRAARIVEQVDDDQVLHGRDPIPATIEARNLRIVGVAQSGCSTTRVVRFDGWSFPAIAKAMQRADAASLVIRISASRINLAGHMVHEASLAADDTFAAGCGACGSEATPGVPLVPAQHILMIVHTGHVDDVLEDFDAGGEYPQQRG